MPIHEFTAPPVLSPSSRPACPKCGSTIVRYWGRERYQCMTCSSAFKIASDGTTRGVGGHFSPAKTQTSALAFLLEGASFNGTCRLTGLPKPTLADLALRVGEACSRYENERLRGLRLRSIQCDEMWTIVHTRRQNIHEGSEPGRGDCWIWTALDVDSRLVVTWRVGPRTNETASAFMREVRSRLSQNAEMITDGFIAYRNAISERFEPGSHQLNRKRNGSDKAHSTAYVERHNLTLRTTMRRFMRRTNAHSKTLRHHLAALGLYFAFYNFARVQKKFKGTPAMLAGLADKPWTLEELIALIGPDTYDHSTRLLMSGDEPQHFCGVCGQLLLFDAYDGVCSRSCRLRDLDHAPDEAA